MYTHLRAMDMVLDNVSVKEYVKDWTPETFEALRKKLTELEDPYFETSIRVIVEYLLEHTPINDRYIEYVPAKTNVNGNVTTIWYFDPNECSDVGDWCNRVHNILNNNSCFKELTDNYDDQKIINIWKDLRPKVKGLPFKELYNTLSDYFKQVHKMDDIEISYTDAHIIIEYETTYFPIAELRG